MNKMVTRTKAFLLTGTTAAMSCLGSHTALAQDTSTEHQVFTLEETIVTAQRRAQSVDDIGVAISAYDGDQLEDLGFAGVGDLAMMTPGVNLTETGVTGVPVYTIRGVGFDDYSANSSSTVGIYLDDVSLPYPTMTRGPQFDIERIEVLKGPQGTLYGRNTTGGAINLISRLPTTEFEAGATLGYGRFDTINADGYVSGSLSNNVRARLSASTTQSNEGWQRSSSRQGDTLGEQDQWAAKALLEWDLSDTATLMLKAHGYRDKSENSAPQYFAYVPLVPELAEYYPAPDPSIRPNLNDSRSADWSGDFTPERDNKGNGVSATLNWEFNGMTLTSISAYEGFEREESNDWDGSSIENLDVSFDTEIDVFSQEIRLASDPSNDLSWVVGAYFSHDELDESWVARGSESTIYQGVFGAVDTRYSQDSETMAAFVHTEWQLAPAWRTTFGLRYTHEEREWAGCSYDVDGGLAYLYSNIDFGPIPGFADHLFLSSTSLQTGDCVTINADAPSFEADPQTGEITVYSGTSGVFDDDVSYDNVSGKLGLDWTPLEDLLIYSSISTGFKSGGYNGAASSSWAQLAPYDEEELTAYELGLKTTFLQDRMRFTSALFYYDYSDKQIIGNVADDVFGLLTQIINVKDSAIWGAEAELEWQATQELYFRLGASWLESEVKEHEGLDGTGVLQDFEGRPLAQTPTWQFTGQVEYRTSITDQLYARIGSDFSYSDEYQSALDPSELFYVEDYLVWNARVGIGSEDGNWELLLWGRNITDEYYYTSANISNDYWFRTPGNPLTWGVQLKLQF